MTTAIQHKPMSDILVPQPEPVAPTGTPAAPVPSPTAAPVVEPQPLPDKYQGKTVEQVAEMHANAEKELGRVRNELGVTKGLVTDLTQLTRAAAAPAPVIAPQEDVNITGDDLISDPVGSVRAIIQPELEAVRKESRETAADTLLGAEAKALEADFGDYGALVATEAFQTFATRTPSRQQDFAVAATGEGIAQVRAARRLLEDWTDFQAQLEPVTPVVDPAAVPVADPVAAARAATTESGTSSAPISGKPQILESDVIALINNDPLKYRSPSYQAELTAAIKEGRFVKNT